MSVKVYDLYRDRGYKFDNIMLGYRSKLSYKFSVSEVN